MPYRFDRIDPTRTAMIVIDMENDFVADGAKLQSKQAHAMVPRLAATLKFCREHGTTCIRPLRTGHRWWTDPPASRSSAHWLARRSSGPGKRCLLDCLGKW